MKSIPQVAAKLDEEKKKMKHSMKSELQVVPPGEQTFKEIPATGLPQEEILKSMKMFLDFENKRGGWTSHKVSGVVYHGGPEHTEFLNKVYSMFSLSNPLHADVFPSIRKWEAEVIKMTANMMRGGPGVCGEMTSGGTESIIMAVKVYRDKCKVAHPEILVPVTVHAAFDKAGEYLGVKVIHIPVDKNFRVDVNAVKKAITKNTILIVGSAPQFPHGTIDPIRQLAALAMQHGIGFHTDSCLGGFILPWVRQFCKEIEDFDFSVPGVTSISCDTHKYGYTTKGTSVLLFANEELRNQMYFVQPNWPGGTYASPGMPGSRPGGLVACAWASIISIGKDGFMEKSRQIFDTAMKIKAGVKNTPHLYLVGDSYSSVIAFGSDLDIFMVSDYMKSRGWFLNNLQKPSCIHICLTLQHVGMEDEFLKDLSDAIKKVQDNPQSFKDGNSAIYGLAATIPDRSVVVDVAHIFLDTLLECPENS